MDHFTVVLPLVYLGYFLLHVSKTTDRDAAVANLVVNNSVKLFGNSYSHFKDIICIFPVFSFI